MANLLGWRRMGRNGICAPLFLVPPGATEVMAEWQHAMKTRSFYLPLGRLLPGMIAAADILGKQGEKLLPADCILDEPQIERLRRRAIRSVLVKLPDERDDETIRRETEAAERRLAHIFRGAGSDARADLYRAVAAYRRKQLA
ncbi:MAG TPA: hypothetical protein VMV33_09045 [Rhodocyclaceae bacterium]|nr:hypothetical protein [Rhodocyclaceae bacterium]